MAQAPCTIHVQLMALCWCVAIKIRNSFSTWLALIIPKARFLSSQWVCNFHPVDFYLQNKNTFRDSLFADSPIIGELFSFRVRHFRGWKSNRLDSKISTIFSSSSENLFFHNKSLFCVLFFFRCVRRRSEHTLSYVYHSGVCRALWTTTQQSTRRDPESGK